MVSCWWQTRFGAGGLLSAGFCGDWVDRAHGLVMVFSDCGQSRRFSSMFETNDDESHYVNPSDS